MKITAVFPGLLLILALAYSQQNCQKEYQKEWYNVYNVNVETKAYYCSYSNENDSQCKTVDNDTILSDLIKECKGNLFVQLDRTFKHQQNKVKLCELTGHVNLLEDTITLTDNKFCRYSLKKCYNENNSKHVFWTHYNICRNVPLIHENLFSVWTKDRSKFIEDTYISLILAEKIKFCGFAEVWKTNYNGIIVSKSLIPDSKKAPLPKLQSNRTEFCNSERYKRHNSKDNSEIQIETNEVKTWYIYKYPINVTVHVCLTDPKDSCKGLHLDQVPSNSNPNLLNQCKNKFCESSACKYEKEMTLCRGTLQVDLEKNSLRGLTSECKYSDGVCKSLNMFWQYTDHCSAFQKVYKGYKKQCGSAKCISEKDNSTKLILSQKGTLCGENIWYTDQDGFVASSRELFSPLRQDKTDEDNFLKELIQQKNEEITKLRTLLHCILFIVLFCIFWYIFNVLVNFMSLRKLNKMRTAKGKVNIINCLSQSLTTYHLSLSQQENKAPEEVLPAVQASRLYETVDNDLYNKSEKPHLKI